MGSLAGLSKDKLVFDPAETADSDNMGAFVRAGTDGDLISSTNVGGKEGLDVNLINASIAVTATDLDIRNLTQTDEVTVFQGTSPWVVGDGGGSLTVDATDLDIRNLTHTQDNVAIAQGGNTMVVNADGSINVNADISVTNGSDKAEDAAHVSADIGTYVLTVREDVLTTSTSADGDYQSFKTDSLGRLWTRTEFSSNVADDAVDSENPIKVGTRAVSGPLAAISAAGDKANMISDLYRRLYVNNGSNIAIENQAVSVDNTAQVALPTTALAGRRTIMVQNLSNKAIYVGKTGVSSANGFRIAAGATGSFDLGQNVAMYAIGDTASAQDVRVFEMA